MIDVAVIGAGAAGLAAARALADAGLQVRILEARRRIGGRIHTVHEPDLALPIELGAEFVHGLPPSTCGLLGKAGLRPLELEAEHLCADDGQMAPCGPGFEKALELLTEEPREDRTVEQLLAEARRTRELDEQTTALARSYVEGFYAARIERASTRAIALEERAAEEIQTDRNFRIAEGYDALLPVLARGLDLRFGAEVIFIAWRPGAVSIGLANGSIERARAAVVALPLGVLQAGSIRFAPSLDRTFDGVASGAVTKLTLRFSEVFWLDQLPAPSFAHLPTGSFPTWWNAWPEAAPLLVAWAGGGASDRLTSRNPVEAALDDLATLLHRDCSWLETKLESAWHWDWSADPFARGAYSYLPVGGIEAQARASAPLADTLYFAGEWTNRDDIGTVSGALDSGTNAARQLLGAGAGAHPWLPA